MYEQSQGIERNDSESVKWYKTAIEQNHTVASYNLGHIYSDDPDIDGGEKLARKYFKMVAEQRHFQAQVDLGNFYFHGQRHIIDRVGMKNFDFYGQGVDKDYRKAIKYLKVAAKQGYSNAQFKLGFCYFYGKGIEKDEDRGLMLVSEAADKDEDRKLVLMSEAVDKDNSQLCTPGELYHSVNSKNQNFKKALECYQQIPESIHSSYGLRGIGLLYEYGDGIDQSYQEALMYYHKASDLNNKAAYYNIALLYYYGNGVVKDNVTSLEWFHRIIKEKMIDECTHVCVQFISNATVAGDAKSSIQKKYSLEPESFIYGEAYYYLSIMYEKGIGTNVDRNKSAEYLVIAISHGNERAKEHFKQQLILFK